MEITTQTNWDLVKKLEGRDIAIDTLLAELDDRGKQIEILQRHRDTYLSNIKDLTVYYRKWQKKKSRPLRSAEIQSETSVNTSLHMANDALAEYIQFFTHFGDEIKPFLHRWNNQKLSTDTTLSER